MKRENFATKFGILAAAAGSAIGLGNIWKFPYITGKNGGAAFILVYLACIIIIGIPVMLSEFAIGRNGQVNAAESFRKIVPKTKWHWTGYLAVSTAFIILSFYSIIAGWVLSYVFRSLNGQLANVPAEGFADYFGALTSRPLEPMIMTLLVLILTGIVVYFGVKSGVEKFNKVVMPLLVVLIVILIFRSLTLDGAMAGVEFLLKPDFANLSVTGVLEALGHSFYTLSLGMGIILTYGSYIDKKENLITLSYQIVIADTLIALMAGLVIFPAVFAYGFEPAAGPGLLFITIPAVFKSMPLGCFFEFIFFTLIAIAAITSTVSLLETVVSLVSEQFNMSRKNTIAIVVTGLFALSIPSTLSFGPLSDIKLIKGLGIFDSLSFLTDQILLPIGGMLICLFVAWVWGTKNAEKEITNDGELKFTLSKVYEISVKYIAPAAILLIFLYGLGILNPIIAMFG